MSKLSLVQREAQKPEKVVNGKEIVHLSQGCIQVEIVAL